MNPPVNGGPQPQQLPPGAPTLPSGVRLMMWKQDPSVTEIGVRKTFLPVTVLEGPRDDRIVIQGMTPVKPDPSGDFLNLSGSQAFDAVHTFAVVRQTVTMYERALAVRGQPSPLLWSWNGPGNNSPLQVGRKEIPFNRPTEKCP